ncbi:Membrane-bound lytic murein transglycosylase D [Aquicella siphonis]|uniref:Membrane-bound lytic murein transglycosylase D n=1 Tax=Aquicella siphonis TaxID=254247 RepID=A0A5E4PES9_9COXI|nr:M56 family metallopeptidase [Aquicella siphonis]VVC74927.1 Membrane-bound lytic murein transglycosylase D [Aquicella siphonis]
MMRDILSLHTYFFINFAVMTGYVFARLITAVPVLNARMQQIHKLKFARSCLLASLLIFLVISPLARMALSSAPDNDFQPVFHHAAAFFSKPRQAVAIQLANAEYIPSALPAMNAVLLVILAGIGMSMIIYFRNMLRLINILKHAYCRHKIHRVRVLFSASCNTAFCWSMPRRHYIILPEKILEHSSDKYLAVRHELQHIRQGDTAWIHLMQLLRWIFFCNPFLYLWIRWLSELQEFACDEEIILKRTTSPAAYAQCLVNAARNAMETELPTSGVIAINGISKSILYRRVNMLFSYKKKRHKLALMTAHTISLLVISTAALAVNGLSPAAPVSTHEIAAIVKKSSWSKVFHIQATSEVVEEINRIRTHDQASAQMRAALDRMAEYKPFLLKEFRSKSMPADLLALPLVESGYRPLDENVNPVRAAGIWQIIPSTGKRLGLVIDGQRDDRMNMKLATAAALSYLNLLHTQFHDWKLAVIAYEIGENETARLIQKTGSRDAWVLARSPALAEKYQTELKKYLAMFDAAVIIMNHPELIQM